MELTKILFGFKTLQCDFSIELSRQIFGIYGDHIYAMWKKNDCQFPLHHFSGNIMEMLATYLSNKYQEEQK